MRATILLRTRGLLFCIIALLCSSSVQAQRLCGIQRLRAAMIARDPSWAARFEAQRASLQGVADAYRSHTAAARLTSVSDTIPIVFHIIVDTDQYNQLGGYVGIAQRAQSQVEVLNEDYNRLNADSVLIPYGWKHLYSAVGLHFGLAHTRPDGNGTPGFEISIIPAAGFYGVDSSYADAKHSILSPGALSTAPGLDAWDVTRYFNIWCINFEDVPGLLGLTVAPSYTTGANPIPADETGICVNYSAFGRRATTLDYYYPTGYSTDHYDMGRTLTHEVGHMFEIWHTWGDDGGLCPWNGGHDDGLADTPPEGDSKYYNYPDTIPGGTYFDQCRNDGAIDTQATLYGVGTLDYMNYTDDIAQHLFTPDQAAVMASQVAPGGESYSLTTHPELLRWPPNASVLVSRVDASVSLYPNPSSGPVTLVYGPACGSLQRVEITDLSGRPVWDDTKQTPGATGSIMLLPVLPQGIYLVRCTFAAGLITRKLIIQ